MINLYHSLFIPYYFEVHLLVIIIHALIILLSHVFFALIILYRDEFDDQVCLIKYFFSFLKLII